MGPIVLVFRLAARDLRRRRGEALALLLAIMATTTTLTLGLILHGVTSGPYEQTRAATAGPDVVANVFPPGTTGGVSPRQLTALRALIRAPGVTGHSGPYPVTWVRLRAHGRTVAAQVEGRDRGRAPVDRPALTQGHWVRRGAVVIERSFAGALGVGAGGRVTLNGRPFEVAGIAVTAAFEPYPQVCFTGCIIPAAGADVTNPGLVWLTAADARSLATAGEPLTYFLNLKLAHPGRAYQFVNARNSASPSAPYLTAWQDFSQQAGNMVRGEQLAMMVGSWLLGLLAVASLAVLVGGRMTGQMRRVGLLKAVGGTPGLVAAVLLAEYLILALTAAAAGLAIGRLAAPLLSSPGAGLLGTPGAPPMTVLTVAVVVGVALAVAVAATFIPALRAARTSTVRALADLTRPPRRGAWAIAVSARLPVPLLLGLRLAARRPRRIVLGVFSIAVTVSGIVGVLIVHTHNGQRLGAASGLDNPRTDRLNEVLFVLTVMLVALAAVNALFITWATVADARRSSAVARALGASPGQVSAGLSVAQLLPALAGAALGIPVGFLLVKSVNHGNAVATPPLWWLAAVLVGTPGVVMLLTAVPARIGARRPVARVLQAE